VTVDARWLEWAAAAALVVLLLVAGWVWSKGRPFAPGEVFKASRWTRGNRLFPTQVLITPSSVVQHTPYWVGRHEETIHMAHVSSVMIDTGFLFSDVAIETSGGSDPIRCYGHRKGDAARMKALIERYQTEYYRTTGASPAPVLETRSDDV
jgi:predicted small integral membrane protein